MSHTLSVSFFLLPFVLSFFLYSYILKFFLVLSFSISQLLPDYPASKAQPGHNGQYLDREPVYIDR